MPPDEGIPILSAQDSTATCRKYQGKRDMLTCIQQNLDCGNPKQLQFFNCNLSRLHKNDKG